MPRLIVSPGHRDERVVELRPGVTTIGRGREADVRVSNKSLSRQHARVVVDADGQVSLADDGSKNGTYVDGERLSAALELRPGQRFSCGDVLFMLAGVGEYSVPAPETMVREIAAEPTRVLVHDLLDEARRRKRSKLGRPKLPNSAEGRLRVLLDVARLLSSPESIDKQLVKILDLVFSILDVDRVAVIMIDEATDDFGPPVVESRRGDAASDEAQIYSKNILNYVRERDVAALFSDAAADPRLEDAHSIHVASVRSSMCAPLRSQDRMIGALYVDNLSSPAVFTSDDLELLSAFAAQAAIAIENSRLYQRLQREAVARSNLLRFFPPTTIAQLLAQPSLTAEPIETEVTALFCDISGFTSLSAALDPVQVVDVLNRYFPIVTEIVFRHEGTLEKYIGDALLAVWGAPFRHEDDARRAVQAAVEMQAAIDLLNLQLTNVPPLRIHIGINSGRVAAGNIGSAHYLQYATIGDATNLASRLCNVAGPGEIAVGVPTVERLGGRIDWPIDGPEYHAIKGRDEPLPVYKLRWRG